MFHHHPPADPLFSTPHVAHAFLLAFTAGSINVGGYMAFGRFVSHVTGFATLFGSEGSLNHWIDAFELLSVPVFFLLGSIISAFLIDRRRHAGQKPAPFVALWLVAASLGLGTWLGVRKFFSPFGEGLDLHRDYLLLALLCTASGIMNGFITTVSNGVLRSTHLTGVTTDLGLGLIRVAYPHSDGIRHAREVRANWLRGGILTSFVMGSMVGAWIFHKNGYMGFALPFLIALSDAAYLTIAHFREVTQPALAKERMG